MNHAHDARVEQKYSLALHPCRNTFHRMFDAQLNGLVGPQLNGLGYFPPHIRARSCAVMVRASASPIGVQQGRHRGPGKTSR